MEKLEGLCRGLTSLGDARRVLGGSQNGWGEGRGRFSFFFLDSVNGEAGREASRTAQDKSLESRVSSRVL
jgi:hypothetical protein